MQDIDTATTAIDSMMERMAAPGGLVRGTQAMCVEHNAATDRSGGNMRRLWKTQESCAGLDSQASVLESVRLRAKEEEVQREWEWLHDMLNRMARERAENGEARAFRLLQEQARVVGQWRVELMVRRAELEQGSSSGGQLQHA